MSFFLTPPVSDLLQIIDESKIMYESRSNDLFIQSVLARVFLHPNEIKWFDDFTYEHLTVYGPSRTKVAGCPNFGGLSYGAGTNITEWEHISTSFLDRFPIHCVSFSVLMFIIQQAEIY